MSASGAKLQWRWGEINLTEAGTAFHAVPTLEISAAGDYTARVASELSWRAVLPEVKQISGA